MINMDGSGASEALGVMDGIATTIQSDAYVSDAIEWFHKELTSKFDKEMHLTAQTLPERFHHVYEWRMTGTPGMQLWDHTLSGRGGTRVASFTWKPSKTPIKTPMEHWSEGQRRYTRVSAEDIAKLSNRPHVFIWKAPMMEYRMPVTITPKNARALWIPAPQVESGWYFSQLIQINTGTEQTAGAFTHAYAEFFRRNHQELTARLEQIVTGQAEGVFIRKTTKARSKTFRLNVNLQQAFERGHQAGAQEMKRGRLGGN